MNLTTKWLPSLTTENTVIMDKTRFVRSYLFSKGAMT